MPSSDNEDESEENNDDSDNDEENNGDNDDDFAGINACKKLELKMKRSEMGGFLWTTILGPFLKGYVLYTPINNFTDALILKVCINTRCLFKSFKKIFIFMYGRPINQPLM